MDRLEQWKKYLETASDEDLLVEVSWDFPDDDILQYASYGINEICNGGFQQYYFNGIFDANLHVRYLRELRLDEVADLIHASLQFFPNGEQPIRTDEGFEPMDDRIAELLDGENPFTELEDKFFAFPMESIDQAYAAYIRKNPEVYLPYVSFPKNL
jgi:hypothetical protein